MGKPEVTIVILGQTDHGKSTLTAAISKAVSRKYGLSDAVSYSEIANYRIAVVKCETPDRIYKLVDFAMQQDLPRPLIDGTIRADGAILVVSAFDGPMTQTREQVMLAHHLGIPSVTLVLTKCDLVYDEELLDLVEMDVRELLDMYGYDGDNAEVIYGRRLDSPGPADENEILHVVDCLDRTVSPALKKEHQPFLMAVEDAFSVTGRGVIATGKVERGMLRIGDELDLVGLGYETGKGVVTGIEQYRKMLETARPGDNIGVLLRGINKDEVERGRVLADQGSIYAHTQFSALIYVFTNREGGLRIPIGDAEYDDFYFRTTEVTGVIRLLEDRVMIMPGDYDFINVELLHPMAMEKGTRFAIRIQGRMIATGVVIDHDGLEATYSQSTMRKMTKSLMSEAEEADPGSAAQEIRPTTEVPQQRKEPEEKSTEKPAEKMTASASETPLPHPEAASPQDDELDDEINDLRAEEVRECEEAAKLGDVDAQYLMGMIYEAGMGGKDPDLNKAVYWYTKAAEHGSEEAREELRRLGLED